MAENSESFRLTIEELDKMLSILTSFQHSDEPIGSCASPETLAALVDGKLNKTEQKNLLPHLASCRDCYAIVAESILIRREWKEEDALSNVDPSARISVPWRMVRTAIVLGAAAVLVIVLYQVTFPVLQNTGEQVQRKKDVQPSPSQPRRPKSETVPSAINTAHDAYFRQAAKYRVPDEPEIGFSRSYAFSPSNSISLTAFRSGVLLIQLEAALGNNQNEIARSTARQLAQVLTTAGAKAEMTDLYRRISNNTSNESMQEYLGHYSAAEQFIQSKGQFTMMKFGEWLECSLLAEDSGDLKFLQSEDLHLFRNQLSLHSLPRGVALNMNEIDKILKDKNQKRSRIIVLLQDTIELLWESA